MLQCNWNVERGAWQAFVERCPEATFFHTPAWYEAMAEAKGYQLIPALFSFSDGTQGLLPLASRPKYKGLVTEAISGIEAGYGGIVAPQPLLAQHVADAYREVGRRFSSLRVHSNPHGAFSGPPGADSASTQWTQTLQILPREEQLKRLSDMRARHIKQAEKGALRLLIQEGVGVSDVSRFYPLYQAHARRWSYTPWVRDEAYFRALLAHGGRHVTLFSAYSDDTLVGFQLVASFQKIALQLHIASDALYSKLHVGPFLVWKALDRCRERGMTTFDFLGSGPLEGIKAFKASFGAEPRPYMTMPKTGPLDRSLDTLRRLTQGRRASSELAGEPG